MGVRGPRKRPAWMKVLSGTQRPDRPPDEPVVPADQVLTELPPEPTWLPNEEARQEWRRVIVLLLERGQLDPMKLGPLGVYCATHGKIQQSYTAGVMPSAHLLAQYRSMAKELGISDSRPQGPSGGAPQGEGRWAKLKERAGRDPG